jgi:hypothetical protein
MNCSVFKQNLLNWLKNLTAACRSIPSNMLYMHLCKSYAVCQECFRCLQLPARLEFQSNQILSLLNIKKCKKPAAPVAISAILQAR